MNICGSERRTRIAFDIALSIHKKIQQRDLEVGRSFGNWILRWLDRAKPSAEIRPSHPPKPSDTTSKQTPSSRALGSDRPTNIGKTDGDSGRTLFSSLNLHSSTFPTTSMIILPPRSTIMSTQQRQYFTKYTPGIMYRRESKSVFRKDIEQWMQLD